VKELIIIRHGEAEHLVGEALTGGWTNSLLTEKGKKQAEAVGKKLAVMLKGKDYDFFCSDLDRAWETAEIIGKAIDKEPMAFRELRELNNGDAANLTRKEADRLFIPTTEPVWDWVPYPNAESWRIFNRRIAQFMNRINETSEDIVVIVTHGGSAIPVIHWWLGLDEEHQQNISFDINPCSITHLRINEWGEKCIKKLNDTSHL
jgi:probable phosphoglycerate mutase